MLALRRSVRGRYDQRLAVVEPTMRTNAHFGGCGGLSSSFFAADLDAPLLPVKAVRGDDPDEPAMPIPLPHLLTDEDSTEVWRITFQTSKCDCLFVPYFTW